jgi:hypothetical protein
MLCIVRNMLDDDIMEESLKYRLQVRLCLSK